MLRRTLSLACFVVFILLPATVFANGRLVAVTPKNGGCVAGPTGPNVEEWDVQPGMTYTLRIDHVTDAGDGGTDPTIEVMVKNSAIGNEEQTAYLVAPGVYEFDFTMPPSDCATSPVRYGIENGSPSSGFDAGRHDTGTAQAHLRAARFGPGCTKPQTINCVNVSTFERTWGWLKSFYR